MLSPNFRKLIAPQAKALGVIWFAFLTATIIYVVLAWVIFGQGAEPALAPAEDQGLGSSTLTGLGMMMIVVLGFGATIYQRKMLDEAVLRAKVSDDPVWPPADSRSNFTLGAEGTAVYEQLSEADKRTASLWPHYQTTMIVVWALLEGLAVVGMVLCFMQRDFMVVVPFALAAVLMLLLKRPRPGQFFANVRV